VEDYIVQHGDTLPIIAEKKLGNKNRWFEIAQLNGIQSPYQLFVGQTIKLPPKLSVAPTPPPPTRVEHQPATMTLARGLLFVIFEQLPEIGSDKVIRKIAAIPSDFSKHPHLSTSPGANITPAEHALAVKPSQYLSSSNRSYGSPTNVSEEISAKYGNKPAPRTANPKDFVGKFRGEKSRPVIIDVNKLPPGTRIVTEQELILDLRRHASAKGANLETLIRTIREVEGETLTEGSVPKDAVKKVSNVHSKYILTAEELAAKRALGQITQNELENELKTLAKAYNRAKIIGRAGRVITVVGAVFTVIDVANAAQRSYEKRSFKPLAAEGVRQIGGWGGAAFGAELGFAVGATFGIVTGPGAIVTGAIGAMVFGAIGYFAADWVADWIDDNSVKELEKDVNYVENMRWRSVLVTVEKNESQYDVRRKALIQAALEAQGASFNTVNKYIAIQFADKIAPIIDTEKAKSYTLNWIGEINQDKNKNGVIDSKEWTMIQGGKFIYKLHDREVNELVRTLFGLAR
jgi:murein DD-endopeptidase MepM/ murein hydrolase activator NlpD